LAKLEAAHKEQAMKNKMKIAGIAAGALVAVAGAGAALAHGGFEHGGHRMMKWAFEHRVSEAEDYVAATPEQRKVIESARDNIEAKFKARMEAHRAEHAKGQEAPADIHDMVRLLEQDKIDQAALYAAIDARADEMKAMAREIVPEVVKAHDALTPAQRQKEMRARFEERRNSGDDDGRGFGGPPPPPEHE
jgi:Spy/CpxP family protein refolding chaperone